MRFIMKWIMRLIYLLVIVAILLFLFGPREPVETDVSFDPSLLRGDPDAYFARREARFDDITQGVEKRVVWNGAAGEVTPLSIVYIHGFSATSEEIRPVPDQVAAELEANLVYTRLMGHGRGSSAMSEATVRGWVEDMAEALAVGRAVGDEVIVISTSTGGTLATLATTNPDMRENIKGMIFVSPNYGINNPAAPLLTWPAARYWVPVIAGAERSFEPDNDGQATYWTTRYDTVATLPMAALVQHVNGLDLSDVSIPALFWFSEQDQVVVPAATHEIADRWGGDVTKTILSPQDGDDNGYHVMTGDIMSPGRTDQATTDFVTWINGL